MKYLLQHSIVIVTGKVPVPLPLDLVLADCGVGSLHLELCLTGHGVCEIPLHNSLEFPVFGNLHGDIGLVFLYGVLGGHWLTLVVRCSPLASYMVWLTHFSH